MGRDYEIMSKVHYNSQSLWNFGSIDVTSTDVTSYPAQSPGDSVSLSVSEETGNGNGIVAVRTWNSPRWTRPRIIPFVADLTQSSYITAVNNNDDISPPPQ